jgi:zinc protease
MNRKWRLAAGLSFLVCLTSILNAFYSQATEIPASNPYQASDDTIVSDAETRPLDQPLPVDPDVMVGKLENGLRYFIRKNNEPENRADLRLVVNAGSILEDEDQLGLAHFLEHMAFNGTKNFKKHELVGFMESIGMRLGPDINASTSFDETIFMLELPMDNPEFMATAFQILEDWAHNLTLDSEEIDKERGVVIEEWRLGQGASERVRDKHYPVLFKGSRYAERLPIGTKESLETFNHDAVRRFYKDWYRPDLIAVIAVGDFDSARVMELIRKHFGKLAGPPNPRERKSYGVPDHEDTLYSIATDKEIPSTSIQVYHMMEPEEERTLGDYRQQIVEQLYNGMLNNRFTELARKPDPPFIGASSGQGDLVRTKSVYALSAAVLEKGVDRALGALFTEAERVARYGFTPSELERQKVAVLRGMERAYTNRENMPSGSFAAEYTRAFLTDEPFPGIEYEYALYQRFVPEIALEEVNRVGRDWIKKNNRVVMLTGPDKEGLETPSEAELAAVLDSVADIEITPYVDTVTDKPLLADLPEGSKVISTRTRGRHH